MFFGPKHTQWERKSGLTALCAVLVLCLGLCAGFSSPVQAASVSAKLAANYKLLAIRENPETFASLRLFARGTDLRARYDANKAGMDELRANAIRSCWRQPWEELRDAFLSIAVTTPRTSLAAISLYRAAECQEELARCANTKKDGALALELYEAVARAYPANVRADDALLAAAIYSSEKQKRHEKAAAYLRDITQRFPASDSAPQARELLDRLEKGRTLARKAPERAVTAVAVRSGKKELRQTKAARSGKTQRTRAALYAKSPIKVVTIDAGHGGIDPGTINNGVIERTITLDVARRVGRILEEEGTLRVVYTRRSNRTVRLERRTEIANASGSDLFVSIHVNANASRHINGLEVYYLDPADSLETLNAQHRRKRSARARAGIQAKKVALNTRVLASRKLALDVLRQMRSHIRKNGYVMASKGIKSNSFHVLAGTAMPAVLAEIGYCTNAKDAKLLKDPAYRQAVAEGIASGILAYRDRAAGLLTAEKSGNTLQ